MKRVAAGAAVVVMAAFATTVAAAQPQDLIPVEADFEIKGPAELSGEFSLDAELSGIILHPGDHTEVDVLIRDALVRLVNVPYQLVATQDESVVGGSSVYIGGEPEVVWKRTWTGTASLTDIGGPESTVRVLPQGDPLAYTFTGDALRVGPPTSFLTNPADDYAALGNVAENSIVSGGIIPDGNFGVVAAADASVEGAMRMVLYGGDYLLSGVRDFETTTGHVLNSTASDPLGQTGTWRYDRLVLLIDAADASVAIDRGAGHLDLLVRNLAGVVSGDVVLHGVQGGLVADQERVGSYGLAQVIGNLSVGAHYGPTSRWGVTGHASFAALDAEPVFGPRGDGLAEAGTISILVATAYGLACLIRNGIQEVLAAIIGASSDGPRGHPLRRQIMRSIQASPGVSRSQLAKSLDESQWLLRYHLKKLSREGAIRFKLVKGAYRFFPDHGRDANGVDRYGEVQGLLGHPVRGRIFELITENGPTSFPEIRDSWASAEPRCGAPSKQLFRYHASILEEAGLIARIRRGRRVLWKTPTE